MDKQLTTRTVKARMVRFGLPVASRLVKDLHATLQKVRAPNR